MEQTIYIATDNPRGAPRPRFARRGGFVQTYMPDWYNAYKEQIQESMPKLEIDEPLLLDVTFYFTPPTSWSKKKQRESIGKYKQTKPDIDNLEKSVLDAGNGHMWVDDNIIVDIHHKKIYAEESGIEIKFKKV